MNGPQTEAGRALLMADDPDMERAILAIEREARVSTPLDVPTRHDFRLVLWLHHGHDGLYGDDGEMQCNRYPPVDFRRDHIDALIGHIGWTQISSLAYQPSTEPAQ